LATQQVQEAKCLFGVGQSVHGDLLDLEQDNRFDFGGVVLHRTELISNLGGYKLNYGLGVFGKED
jgi:hypothetical protein